MSENDIIKADRKATAKSVINREADIMKEMEKNISSKNEEQGQESKTSKYPLTRREKREAHIIRFNRKLIDQEREQKCPDCGKIMIYNSFDYIYVCHDCGVVYNKKDLIDKLKQKCIICHYEKMCGKVEPDGICFRPKRPRTLADTKVKGAFDSDMIITDCEGNNHTVVSNEKVQRQFKECLDELDIKNSELCLDIMKWHRECLNQGITSSYEGAKYILKQFIKQRLAVE